MEEGFFDADGYYHAIINGVEVVFESWTAWKDYVSGEGDE